MQRTQLHIAQPTRDISIDLEWAAHRYDNGGIEYDTFVTRDGHAALIEFWPSGATIYVADPAFRTVEIER